MSVRIPRQPDCQPLEPVKTVYILDDDAAASEALCAALARDGYRAQALVDAAEALAMLRASDGPCALFFDVEAYGKALDGRGFVSLIGALLRDPALARSHVVAVISSTPDDVEWTLGKSLARLGARVIGKPCDVSCIEAFLALAAGRIVQPAEPQIALAGQWYEGARLRDEGAR